MTRRRCVVVAKAQLLTRVGEREEELVDVATNVRRKWIGGSFRLWNEDRLRHDTLELLRRSRDLKPWRRRCL